MAQLNRHSIRFLGIFLVLCSSSVAFGRESAQRAAFNRKSLQAGLGVGEVSLLRRLPGPGAETVVQRLITGFAEKASLAGKFAVNRADGKLYATSGSVRFRVDDDGTRIRYDNRTRVDDASYQRVSVENRMSHERLVELGLAFIAGPLADFVKVGPRDKIVPLQSEYEIEGGVDHHGKRDEEKVVSATIVLGRTIDGTHVIGSGSKVSITFGNNAAVLAFSVDWPGYESVPRRQQVLGISEIWERVSALSTMRFGADDVRIRRFECGYFDDGARLGRDTTALIQAACAVHYVGSRNVTSNGSAGAIQTAIVDQIPVGVVVEPDSGWPHATALLTHGDVCAVSEVPRSEAGPLPLQR